MTELEKVISEPDDYVSTYLGEVSISDFRKHVKELKSAYADYGAIKNAIAALNTLLPIKREPSQD